MRVSYPSLKTLLDNNVIDVRFTRRRQQPSSPTRRMLCTNCKPLLNSTEGRMVLNFRPTAIPNPPNYWPPLKNLIVVWDIMMQDYRQISVETADVMQVIPPDKFWDFFKQGIYKLSPQQKIDYMDHG